MARKGTRYKKEQLIRILEEVKLDRWIFVGGQEAQTIIAQWRQEYIMWRW